MSVNTRSNKDRDEKNTTAPSSQDEVEAYEASNGADMPIFANILPKPMSLPPAEATALPLAPPMNVVTSGRKKTSGARASAPRLQPEPRKEAGRRGAAE